jgi:hypothetical protein
MKTASTIFCVLAAMVLLLAPAVSRAQESDETAQSAAAVLEQVIEESGAGAVAAKYNELKSNEEQYVFDATEFIRLGHRLLQEDRVPEAVAILEITVERFPDARWSYFLMATAYFRAGLPDLAIENQIKRQVAQEKTQLEEFLKTSGDSLATTAEEVIEKHIKAIGGLESISKVRTMVVKFGINDTNGKTMSLVRHYKRPAFYRQEVVGSGRFIATDGETTWSVEDGEWTESDEPWYRRVGRIDDFFTDYADHGLTYTFAGVEILNHTPVYRLMRTFWDGVSEDLFFSIETGYLTEVRSEYPQSYPMMLSYMSFWDYRDVGGIKIPHVFIRNVGPLGPPHGGVLQDIQVNVSLDDSLFVESR